MTTFVFLAVNKHVYYFMIFAYHSFVVMQLNEPASILFERPVDVTMFSDYLKYVKVPMDIATVETNVETGLYTYAEGEHEIFYCICIDD